MDDLSALVEEYVQFRRENDQPAKLIFLGFSFKADFLRDILASPELVARKSEIEGNGKCSIEVWIFEINGAVRRLDSAVVDPTYVELVRKIGMATVSQRRAVVFETHSSFHYVKPSGQHVDRFVRAANALVRGAEVTFIASWLLRFMQHEIRVMHCDTSGIAALAYSAISLKSLFTGQALPVSVESFGSYDGLSNDTLESPSATLVLISASTSGSMAKKIADSGVPFGSIVTIFYLGEAPPQYHVLCDLNRSRNTGGSAPARNQTEADCELCARGSIPLRMEGDGFLPEPPKVTFCLVLESHIPAWLHSFVTAAVASRAVRSAVSRVGTDTTDEIYIDAHRLIREDQNLREKWARLLSRGVPADVTRIVYFEDDSASKAFAHELETFLAKRAATPPAIFGFGRNASLKQTDINSAGATVVVASALVKGRRITSASRELRESPGPIVYIAALGRTESQEAYKRLRSNLVKSTSGVDHAFQCALEIQLPSARPDSASSWACERRQLEEWSNRTHLPDALVERLDVLSKGMEAGERGFRDQLFLRSIQGYPLKLRKNSIFIPKTCDPAIVSQADVFLCVSATLHKLRGEPAGPETLGRGLRHHALLDPANFERFTDGVIQASFLRAALPIEIDYTVDATASGNMVEFLRALFRNPEAQGEAALEFSMAIATRRLRLAATDQQSLQRQWEVESSRYPDSLRALVDLVRSVK
ncbi:MAG: hypothetical protein ABIZ04_09095 [Opitutus sp.]